MSSTRAYRSDLRSAQAEATRSRIRSAARTLFESQGFAATTVGDIADAAGVSHATVFAVFGSKSALLREMMDELEALADGDDAEQRLFAATSPEQQLDIFVDWIVTLFGRGQALLRAASDARSDSDVAAFVATGNARRLEGTTMLTAAWGAAGDLRPGLEPADAARSLWLLTSGEAYLAATTGLGMSVEEYSAWLHGIARREILAPRSTGA